MLLLLVPLVVVVVVLLLLLLATGTVGVLLYLGSITTVDRTRSKVDTPSSLNPQRPED